MVKILLFIVIVLLPLYNIQAQRFNAYITSGLAVSQVSGDALAGFDKAGIAAAAGVITPLSRTLSMGFQIGFLQKGSRKPDRLDQGDPVQYLMRLNYMEIPVYIKYKAGRKISFFAGPSVGVLLSAKEENENGEFTYMLPFNDLDISVTGAVTYNLSNRWQAALQGVQSVTPVRSFGGQALPFFQGGQYNSVMMLLLAYYFFDQER